MVSAALTGAWSSRCAPVRVASSGVAPAPAATTLFAADTAGLMLLTKDGSLAAASAFDQQGELAELAQELLGQEPCMEAFTWLRRMARNTSRPLPEVAREVIDGVCRSPNNYRPPKPGRGNEVAQQR
jgi:hypothetical protein